MKTLSRFTHPTVALSSLARTSLQNSKWMDGTRAGGAAVGENENGEFEVNSGAAAAAAAVVVWSRSSFAHNSVVPVEHPKIQMRTRPIAP